VDGKSTSGRGCVKICGMCSAVPLGIANLVCVERVVRFDAGLMGRRAVGGIGRALEIAGGRVVATEDLPGDAPAWEVEVEASASMQLALRHCPRGASARCIPSQVRSQVELGNEERGLSKGAHKR